MSWKTRWSTRGWPRKAKSSAAAASALGAAATTYERVEEILPVVVKKDGRRESFDRAKILSGIKKACEKRPISTATIEDAADRIEKRIQEMGESEIKSRVVGEEVMKELHQLDQVAYVRFASVYREFKDIDQFMDELKVLAQQRRER